MATEYGFQETPQAERAKIVVMLRQLAARSMIEATATDHEVVKRLYTDRAAAHEVAADLIERGAHFYTTVPVLSIEPGA